MGELDNIREKLKKHRLSFTWLIYQLELHDISTDKTEISAIFAGSRKGAKVDSIITESDKILKDYEKRFARNA
jgi:hypothetical protein